MSWTIQNFDNNGFAINPVSFAVGGAITPGQTRYVYNFNGVNSHIQFSSVELTPSDALSFKITNFTSPNAVGARFVGSEDFSFSIDAGVSGSKFRLVNCTAKLNGVPIESEVTEIPTSGIHDVEVTPLITASINAIGCKSGTFDRLIKASLFDFKINDGSIYNYPINDRTFGAGAVIANTGSGPDATGVNLLESGWQEIPL